MTKNDDKAYQENAIVIIYLPPLPTAGLFEIHAAIKTALGGLDGFKIDFRILGQKDGGGLVNQGAMPKPDSNQV
ncbi:hypothetical protein LCGC14_0872350 [marine sediment metagenome]|uniref:Uncharacterized protein n=1 Tax=marine sediment metagenome TaxID=412755 RepID=A0A0F9SB94_9ZZZZ